jgi:hypothetical protein
VCLLAAPVFCQTEESASARLRDVKAARLTSNERIAAYEKLLQQSPADPKIQAGWPRRSFKNCARPPISPT